MLPVFKLMAFGLTQMAYLYFRVPAAYQDSTETLTHFKLKYNSVRILQSIILRMIMLRKKTKHIRWEIGAVICHKERNKVRSNMIKERTNNLYNGRTGRRKKERKDSVFLTSTLLKSMFSSYRIVSAGDCNCCRAND
jgi:hypothetical protein